MKIIAGEQSFIPSEVPVILLWKDDEERLAFANTILNMPAREGVRAYAIIPSGHPGIKELMKKEVDIYLGQI